MKNTFKFITVAALIIAVQFAFISCSKSSLQNKDDRSKINTINDNSEERKSLNKNIYDLSVRTMDGDIKSLSDYKGKVLLIVNVASRCGFTPQYQGLETIYEKYKDRGFEVLAFPCNDFGGQEPGTNDEIRTFCESKYNVTFPLFDKVNVLGNDKSLLYERLINNSNPPGDVEWNFEKFLIDKNGDIAGRYKSKIKPESGELISAVETELSK